MIIRGPGKVGRSDKSHGPQSESEPHHTAGMAATQGHPVPSNQKKRLSVRSTHRLDQLKVLVFEATSRDCGLRIRV